MPSSSKLGIRNNIWVMQMLLAGGLVTLSNVYYWFILDEALVSASSVNLCTIIGLVYLLPASAWRHTLPTITVAHLVSYSLFSQSTASPLLGLAILAGGFLGGYIGKHLTNVWSANEFSGYFATYLPTAPPTIIAYLFIVCALNLLHYGNDFLMYFKTTDEIFFHLHLLEFTVLGGVVFAILQLLQQSQPAKNWPRVIMGAALSAMTHLVIIYLFPNNYWLLGCTLLASAYLVGSIGTATAIACAAGFAPFKWGLDGNALIASTEYTNYALLGFVMNILALMRDGFANAARQGKPYSFSLSPTNSIKLTMEAPEVESLRLQLEQQSVEIINANRNLEEKNAELHRLTTHLELQKQTYKHLVEIDELTNLKSRRFFSNQIADGVRNRDYCILMIDMDNFKSVNDIYGHHAGDLLLIACAKVFHRECSGNTFAARLGGEEFCIALDTNELQDALKFAEQIRQQIANTSIKLHNIAIKRSISVGLAKLKVDDMLKDIMSQADAALYEAKQAGKNCVRAADQQFIESWLQGRKAPKLEAIIKGIDNNEFVFHLQPICKIDNGDIVGFEALMRWERADGSVLAPSHFLELALSRPAYSKFRKKVMLQIIPIMQKLHELNDTYYLSVNADSAFFHTSRYVGDIITQLKKAGSNTTKLVFELPETAQIHDHEMVLKNVNYLRQNGVHIALDDFGMEHSNMDRIRDFPVDYVKIDRSFIRDLQLNPRSIAIVSALVTMSKELHFDIIAEGIEDKGQAEMLIDAGVTRVQGYYYGEPKPLHHWLKNGKHRDIQL